MKILRLLIIFIGLAQICHAQAPQTNQGKIDFYPSFKSNFIPAIDLAIWLPSNYDANQKYSVLYLQDGGSLFDAKITWNQQEWGIDECLDSLIAAKKVTNMIVVGIYNSGKNRHASYFPQKPFEQMTATDQQIIFNAARSAEQKLFHTKIYSDSYLKFIVEELKPFVDQKYATHKDAKHTSIGGSSMGGLISLYAICEYPNVFGSAMCLSTHWPGIFESADNPFPKAFENYLTLNLPQASTHQIYFDYGTATLDAIYEPYQLQINQIFQGNGYQPHQFKCNKYDGAEHTENAWSARLNDPILFLFKTNSRN
jgi:enterochelin esterase-like enzyme